MFVLTDLRCVPFLLGLAALFIECMVSGIGKVSVSWIVAAGELIGEVLRLPRQSFDVR